MRRRLSIRTLILAITGCALFGAIAEPAQARPGWRGGLGQSFDDNRSGEIVRERQRAPLIDVARRIKSRFGGEMLDARIVEGGPHGEMYVIKWLTDDGRKIEFLVDAESGSIVDQRGG